LRNVPEIEKAYLCGKTVFQYGCDGVFLQTLSGFKTLKGLKPELKFPTRA